RDTRLCARRDAVDDRGDLLDRTNTSEEELLPGEPTRHAAGVLEAKLEAALREVADAFDLDVGHELLSEALHFSHDRLQDLGAVLRREARVHDEVPSIGVVRAVAVHVVREAALLSQLEKEPARHPLAKNGIEHVE